LHEVFGASADKTLPAIFSNADGSTKIPERVRQFALKAAGTGGTDFDKATRIKEAIESLVFYDLQAPAVPGGVDPVEHFLFEQKRGYCDLFASAMVVCARAVGLPARYVTGYYPSRNEFDQRGNLVVHESEAHAWAEVAFEGAGWVPFDPTEGAPTLGQPTNSERFYESQFGRLALLFIFGAVLVVGPYLVYKVYRTNKLPVDPARRALGKSYARFSDHLELLSGKVKRPSQTPLEYLEIVQPLIGSAGADAEVLTQEFVRALYAPEAVSAATLGVAVEKFRKAHRKPGKGASRA
jgi:transglutaminase-like putative cysteine protease